MAIFITTQDRDTKDLLIKEGFQLVEDSSNRWVFINNVGKFAVSSVDKNKVHTTDIICT